MDLVIVPAWRRADFLLATLKRLEIAAAGRQVEFWLVVDRAPTPEVGAIARGFAAVHGARIRQTDHPYHGNSYNVLTAYQEACALRDRPALVHLIEEDVFVGRDYFAFAERAHDLAPFCFAVSACKNQNDYALTGSDETGIYLHDSYQSLAVSFRPRQLERVLAHTRPEYFAAPVEYCRDLFPDYPHGTAFAEQDGLLRRVALACGLMTAYPYVPRAYHAGFHGYNRTGTKLSGNVETRAADLLAMTAAQLNGHATSNPDHETISLDAERAAVAYVA